MEENQFLTTEFTQGDKFDKEEAADFRTAQLRALYLVHQILAKPVMFEVIKKPENLKEYFPRVTKDYVKDTSLFVDFMRFISRLDTRDPNFYHGYLEAVRNMSYDKDSYKTLRQLSMEDEYMPIFDMKAYINLICEVKDNKIVGFSNKLKNGKGTEGDWNFDRLTDAVNSMELASKKLNHNNDRSL